MSRKRFSGGQWRAWFDEFDASGLTVERFCKTKNTTANTFYLWRKKLGLGSVRSSRVQESSSAVEAIGETVQRRFVTATPIVDDHNGEVEIELPSAVKIRVRNACDSLRPVLQVLIELGTQS